MKARDLQQQLDATARAGALFGLALPDEPAPDLVGWCRPAPGTVKGQGHRCIDCQPQAPGPGWEGLVRSRLAARERCTACGRRLEDVTRGTA